MPISVIGIICGGQLGIMLATAAKKINIKTVILSDDEEAPAKNFSDEFIYGNYHDDEKIRLWEIAENNHRNLLKLEEAILKNADKNDLINAKNSE